MGADRTGASLLRSALAKLSLEARRITLVLDPRVTQKPVHANVLYVLHDKGSRYVVVVGVSTGNTVEAGDPPTPCPPVDLVLKPAAFCIGGSLASYDIDIGIY